MPNAWIQSGARQEKAPNRQTVAVTKQRQASDRSHQRAKASKQ